MSRPTVTAITAATVALAVLSPASDAIAQSGPLPPIRVHGSVPIWNVQGPVLVARAKGFFDRVGLKEVEFKVGGNDVESVRGLAAGGFDILINSSTPTTVRAISLGADIKIVGGFAHQARYTIFVKKGMAAADLKGKAIAVADLEDFTSQMLKLALKQVKLDPERDVRMVPAGAPGARMAAHFAGQVDASMNIYNLLPVYQSRGFEPLINLHEVKDFEPWSLITVSVHGPYLAKNPQAVTAFLAAAIMARSWYHDPKNADELRKILKDAGIEFRTDQAWDFEYALDREMTPTDFNLPKGHFDNTVRVMRELGAIARPVEYDKAVDLSFLAKAQAAANRN